MERVRGSREGLDFVPDSRLLIVSGLSCNLREVEHETKFIFLTNVM